LVIYFLSIDFSTHNFGFIIIYGRTWERAATTCCVWRITGTLPWCTYSYRTCWTCNSSSEVWSILLSHWIIIWYLILFDLNICPRCFPMTRDGEKIHISKYACCNEDECECKIAIENTFPGTKFGSAVTLQLWRGFYHDRCRDIVKVCCNIWKGSSMLSHLM